MIESIGHRRSIRKYKDIPVEDEKLQQVLEAARLAPSGNNRQPWVFILIKDEEIRKRVAQVTGEQQWIASAPVVIVVVADLSARTDRYEGRYLDEESPEFDLKRSIRDTAIAVEHILLEADNQGLGTCWCGAFRQKNIRPVLNIPDDKFVLAVIPLGYADEEPRPRPRKDLETILRYESW